VESARATRSTATSNSCRCSPHPVSRPAVHDAAGRSSGAPVLGGRASRMAAAARRHRRRARMDCAPRLERAAEAARAAAIRSDLTAMAQGAAAGRMAVRPIFIAVVLTFRLISATLEPRLRPRVTRGSPSLPRSCGCHHLRNTTTAVEIIRLPVNDSGGAAFRGTFACAEKLPSNSDVRRWRPPGNRKRTNLLPLRASIGHVGSVAAVVRSLHAVDAVGLCRTIFDDTTGRPRQGAANAAPGAASDGLPDRAGRSDQSETLSSNPARGSLRRFL
jgi:hypothetical protein